MEKRRHLTTFYIVRLYLMLTWLPVGDGYGNCLYGGNCRFEPSPPGQAPKCASPGLTYCVNVDTYPREVINHLITLGSYDINTLLTDESTEDFSAAYRPKKTESPYGYGPNSLPGIEHISLVEESPFKPYSVFDQDNLFLQNTPLRPPAPDPYLRPVFRPSNFSKLTNPSLNTNGKLNPNLYDYYNNKGRGQSFFNNHVFNPSFNLPSNGWTRYSVSGKPPGSSTFNPLEWWRYTNPRSNARRDENVTIQKSISFPPITTTYYPDNRKFPNRNLRKKRSISGKRALALAMRESQRSSNDETLSRFKRQDNSVEEKQELCDVRTQYVTPKAALNKEGEWRYIVNMEDNMTQLVRAEICVSKECSGLCNLPLGYKSKCEQKYLQKRLVALDSGGQNLYTDVFWIPSCCQCTITRMQGT